MAKFIKIYGEHINVNKIESFYPMEIVKESKLTKGAYIAGVIVVDDEEYELTFKPAEYDSEEEKINALFKYIKTLTACIEVFLSHERSLVLNLKAVEESIKADLNKEKIEKKEMVSVVKELDREPIQANIKVNVYSCEQAEKCMEEFIEFRKEHNDIDYSLEIEVTNGLK